MYPPDVGRDPPGFEGDPNDLMPEEVEAWPKDTWERIDDYALVRRHNTPRLTLYDPSRCDDDCPIDLDKLDVVRTTVTDIQDVPGEHVIVDTCCAHRLSDFFFCVCSVMCFKSWRHWFPMSVSTIAPLKSPYPVSTITSSPVKSLICSGGAPCIPSAGAPC